MGERCTEGQNWVFSFSVEQITDTCLVHEGLPWQPKPVAEVNW